MKKKLLLSSVLATATVATPLVAITSCEFDEEGTVTNKVTSVSIKGLGQIEAGTSTQFTANVHGKGKFDKKVTWSIKQEDTLCSINPETGKFYAGTEREKCTIVATSVENPEVFDTFEVSTVYLVHSVSINWMEPVIEYGSPTTHQIYASVDCTPGCDTSLRYSIDTPNSGCHVTQDGFFFADSCDTVGEKPVTVRVTSVYDPSKTDTHTVTVVSKVKEFSIDSSKKETVANGAIQFSSSISVTRGLPTSTIWSISKHDETITGSKIDENGLFTAGTGLGSVTVRGTPEADPSQYKEIEITVIPDTEYSIDTSTSVATLVEYRGLDKTFIVPSTIEDPKTNKSYPVTTIGKNCFGADAINLETVLFSSENNVETIEERAFDHSTIKNITIPKKVKSIGEGAFAYCQNGLHIKFDSENQMTTLPELMFSHTDGLVITEESLPKNLTIIPERFTADSTNTSFFIRKNIVELGGSAFVETHFKSITYDPDIELITIGGSAFEGADNGGQDFVIPNSVTTIGERCFFDSNFYVIINEESKLTEIPRAAFYFGHMNEILFPARVSVLCTNAVGYCTELKHIYLKNKNITLIQQYFTSYCRTLEYIEYPGTSLEWAAIPKEEKWYGSEIPQNAYIKCTDTDVPIFPTNK